MFSPAFDYHRAATLADAHQLLAAHPGAKLLAGGHSLLPALKLRLSAPPALIDIGRIAELRGISQRDHAIHIGALTRHGEIAAAAVVKTHAAALAEAAAHVGDPAVRNRGTIGGNIAHADPASDLPTVLVALDASIVASRAASERRIPAAEFFTGLMTTVLADAEIVSAITVPVPGAGTSSAYCKFSHPASRYAVIGVAACLTVEGGRCTTARVALGGLLPSARRAGAVEAALVGTTLDDAALESAAAAVASDLGDDVTGDIFASAGYRAGVAPVYVKRALAAARGRQ